MEHRVGITNLDAHGLSRNPSPLAEDLIRARWHGDCDLEAVLNWHEAADLTLFSGATIEVLIQSSDDETNRPEAIADIWEHLPVLYKLQLVDLSFVYIDNGKVQDWTLNNKLPLGECVVI